MFGSTLTCWPRWVAASPSMLSLTMTNSPNDGLLSRLADESDPSAWSEVPAQSPRPAPSAKSQGDGPPEAKDAKLDELLGRLGQLTGTSPTEEQNVAVDTEFVPLEPSSFRQMELTDTEIESLLLKYLLARGDASGREVAEQTKLPFVLLEDLLRQLKFDQLLVYRGTAPMNDYIYQLTDLGRERARRYVEHCTYFGSAPVVLSEYIKSVHAQSLTKQHPTNADLERTFKDLLINPNMLRRLGPAINSGKGMFLFGAPGNGKTSIARRVTSAFGKYIWIPRAIGMDGEIMRLFDPMSHEEAPLGDEGGLLKDKKIDHRWVRIRRPTIIVGGELTMDYLEVMLNNATGINESPIQLKANCGTLVIDDFGRQRMPVDELLNRWIVPLEDRVDYLNLASGKTIKVPFDQLIVFSTNLEPRDLVDEAFLRRIPYKIEVVDPTEEEFRKLFKIICPILGFEYNEAAVGGMIEKHYLQEKRAFRCCHPRDLLQQVHDLCVYMEYPLELRPEYFDAAAENYFSVM